MPEGERAVAAWLCTNSRAQQAANLERAPCHVCARMINGRRCEAHAVAASEHAPEEQCSACSHWVLVCSYHVGYTSSPSPTTNVHCIAADVELVSAQISDFSSNPEAAVIMIQSVHCTLHDLTVHTPTWHTMGSISTCSVAS